LISIITVTFNCEELIQKTMESVKAVKRELIDLQHIIIDGKSTDNTIDLIKQYQFDYLVSEKDEGIYDAINKGIEQVDDTNYIAILHAGDTLCVDGFKQFLNVVKGSAPDLLAFSLSEQGCLIKRSDYRLSLLSPAVKHPGLVISKGLHNELGFYDIGYQISADYDFVCKVLNSKKSIYYCNDVLIDQAPYGFSGDQKRFIEKKLEHLSIISSHVKFPLRVLGILRILLDILKGVLHLKMRKSKNV